MSLKCHCGSKKFKPVGIQEGWSSDTNGKSEIIFLVNCSNCETTLSCNRLDYAFIQSYEFTKSLDISFFADEPQPAMG